MAIPIDEVQSVVDGYPHRDACGEDSSDVDRVAKPGHHAKNECFGQDVWNHDQETGSDSTSDEHHDRSDQQKGCCEA